MNSDKRGQKIKKIKELGPWFHNIHLPGAIQTAPDHFLGDFPGFKWEALAPHIPGDLQGWKVLDIGCNAGFYSFELAERGAEVLGIDLDEHYLEQARWVAGEKNLQDLVTFRQMQVYDLAHQEDRFDMIWFMGVFYHLRYPLLALDILSQKVDQLFVIQTLMMPGKEEVPVKDNYNINERQQMLEEGYPKMAFIEKNLNHDPTNWWAPNRAGMKAMLRTCGLEIVKEPLDETFVCRRSPDNENVATGWNRSEYLAAVGQPYESNPVEKLGEKKR